jgi:hypothetical protein
MNKTKGFDYWARLSKVPDCPYMQIPCRNFYFKFEIGACFQDGVKCSWEQSSNSVSGCSRFAVLKKDGRLHV